MSIVAAAFLFLALVAPGSLHPHISIANLCAVIWFVIFILEKTGRLSLP